jgi:tRNA 2-thiouridine synthesizing protein A
VVREKDGKRNGSILNLIKPIIRRKFVMAMKFEKTGEGTYMLDVCGYVCPHPQIYCKKSLEKMNEGDVVEVILDNPSSVETITQMCDQIGNDILNKKTEGGKIYLKIKKG